MQTREGQLEAKQRILSERDSLVNDLTQQLEDRTKSLEAMQGGGGGGEVSKAPGQ